MKILLVHPEDDPEAGPWAGQPWDRILDLGMAGQKTYERWSQRFRCPVTTWKSLHGGFEDLRQVRRLLDLGCGQLVDEYGLDWWEIMSLLRHGELETLIVLQRFAQTVGSGDEVHVSRPGLHASLLQPMLGARLNVSPMRGAKKGSLTHYARLSRKLSAPQIIDVFWDKYDSGYQLRGRFVRKRYASQRPVVLLPTAYVNVSRTGISYANTFPEENFLLVTTRRSGWLRDLPNNVQGAWLSSFAAVRDRDTENVEMEHRWRSLLTKLAAATEFGILNQLGYLEDFPRWLRHGFEVRDAWRNVLDTEPVQAVLCADDSNPYTRIPLLLAQAQGLPSIACHHGALDGRYVFKRSYGDVIWAKGKMEEDYLVRKCGVPPEKVEIAAPALPVWWHESGQPPRSLRPYLIFFSEPCENLGGRTDEFYRDILPPLANLALAAGRELIVKLHPAESKQERGRTLGRILSARQKSATRIVSGPLVEELLSKAWLGITILSSVTIECAVRGIPCFVCKWLEFGPYEYVEQFTDFGVGIGLNDPSEIEKIPEYLQRHPVNPDIRENCWRAAAPGRLRKLVASSHDPCITAAS